MVRLAAHAHALRPLRPGQLDNDNRKAVRATLILIPLLGLHYMLTPFRPEAKSEWEVIYEIIAAVCTSFQGLCVAMLFCFCNGEVISAVRKKLKDSFMLKGDADGRPMGAGLRLLMSSKKGEQRQRAGVHCKQSISYSNNNSNNYHKDNDNTLAAKQSNHFLEAAGGGRAQGATTKMPSSSSSSSTLSQAYLNGGGNRADSGSSTRHPHGHVGRPASSSNASSLLTTVAMSPVKQQHLSVITQRTESSEEQSRLPGSGFA